MKSALVFEATRSHYSVGQQDDSGRTMTVAELIGILQDYDEDTLIVISHDNGYTYGTLDYPRYWETDEHDEWFEV